MAMNNETSGKPVLMKFKDTPVGGSEANATKPGSGGASGTTKYNLRTPEAFYNVSGGPTLGNPMGGPEENASSKTAKPLKRITVPNMAPNNSARN
jgi:hypothetical protein